jgi:hypothetical protein
VSASVISARLALVLGVNVAALSYNTVDQAWPPCFFVMLTE